MILAYYNRVNAVGDGSDATTIISKLNQYDIDVVSLNIKNEHGSVAFDTLILQFKSHPDAGWVTVESTGWATADNIVLTASNPATLAAAAEMFIKFRTDGIYGWQLIASGNAAASGPVEVWGVGIGDTKGNPIPS